MHAASQSAREKVEAAGGTLTVLREPKERKPKNLKRRARGPHQDGAPTRGGGRGAAEGDT